MAHTDTPKYREGDKRAHETEMNKNMRQKARRTKRKTD